MCFTKPKIRVPTQRQLANQIPEPPEPSPRVILRPEGLESAQLAAQTLGTRQLGGGLLSDLNLPTF